LAGLQQKSKICSGWPLSHHQAINAGSIAIYLHYGAWFFQLVQWPFGTSSWPIGIIKKCFLAFLLGHIALVLVIPGLDQSFQCGGRGQAGILGNFASMDELDYGEASWPQLEVLVAIKLDDQVFGQADGLLILEFELHPAADLYHGAGVEQI